MELYILSKQDLSILSICKVANYEINLDEETNAKTIFTLMKTNGLEDGNFLVLNGLYRQFLFVIEDGGVKTEKDSNVVTVTALDISNIFNRKVIEKNIETMKTKSIEEFIANTMYENFVNSEDTILNINYIDIAWHTNTQASVATNAENGLYNFHTFLINCRQYKNIYTEFKFENNRLKIDISYKEETAQLIDTTLPEVTDYNKVYEEDVTARVQVYIRENGSEYNLYLRTDRTTTTDIEDENRAKGKIEVISVDTADKAHEEALNVLKGNSYKHLVEFKIAKTSKLMDITKLHIGCPVRIKTNDDIYDSYISAITLTDENFVYFKSGSLRTTLLDKLKKNTNGIGDKLDKSGGIIRGNLNVEGNITKNDKEIVTHNTDKSIISDGTFNKGSYNIPAEGALTQIIDDSESQHSVIVGKGKDGKRYYGIDLYDSYNRRIMRLYSGNKFLEIDDALGLFFNGHAIPWISTDKINIGDLSQFTGNSGYKNYKIPCPAKTLMVVTGLHTAQVSNSNGLQITNIYNGVYDNSTSSSINVDYWLNYYASDTVYSGTVYLDVLYIHHGI